MDKIIRIKYTLTTFDFSTMRFGARTVTDIYMDGRITIASYDVGSRKATSRKKYTYPVEQFDALCSGVTQCIATADSVMRYIDDCAHELTIYHQPARTEKMDGGLGSAECTVREIVRQFLNIYVPDI